MDSVNVLMVEDDEDDYVITRDLLSEIDQTDYIIDWVTTYTDALEKLKRADVSYDVCLLDYHLGNQTGVEIMRIALAEGSDVPMVLLTEHSDRQTDLTAMREGASDFIVKGEINSTNLDRVIRYVCAVKKHEQERMRLALALEANKQAEAANKSKDEFLGMVSHELRGPINTLLLWTEILKAPDTDPETKSIAINTIESTVKQQNKILNDLLELTRSQNNLIKLNKTKLNLNDFISTLVNTQQPVANKKHIALTLMLTSSQFVIDADSERLQQIFSNIVTNAIKFTPEQGLIEIKLTPSQLNNQPAVAVSVQDNGIGMAPEVLERVFDRYLQAPESYNTDNTGLGLGLCIAKQLVELHGGAIQGYSAGLNAGSTFIVTLPLADNNNQ